MTLSIQTTDLRIRYGDTEALHGLDLDLPGGKIYGLLGRNGAGKSTLLGALAGFRNPSAGTVLVGGQPVFENVTATTKICLIREDGWVGDPTDNIGDILENSLVPEIAKKGTQGLQFSEEGHAEVKTLFELTQENLRIGVRPGCRTGHRASACRRLRDP